MCGPEFFRLVSAKEYEFEDVWRHWLDIDVGQGLSIDLKVDKNRELFYNKQLILWATLFNPWSKTKILIYSK